MSATIAVNFAKKNLVNLNTILTLFHIGQMWVALSTQTHHFSNVSGLKSDVE
jgi:hypothetical protein